MNAVALTHAKRRTEAFTLLEILVVLGLLAVLAGLLLGSGRYALESGRSARARSELVALAAALEAYKLAQGDYPATDDPAELLQALIGRRSSDLRALNFRPVLDPGRFTTADAQDPYEDPSAVLLDPWDQSYRYAYKSQAPWTNPTYVLLSTGPDRKAAPVLLLAGGYVERTAPDNVDNLTSEVQP